MTCIVGLIDSGAVWIGGDSAGVVGYSLVVRDDAKVFRNGSFLIGYTSSFRMGQLLRFRFAPPENTLGDGDDFRFMATEFVDAARECFKEYGYAEIDKSQERGGSFLVGYRGRLYVVSSDYQVGVPADPFAAVGCGDDIALGAMYATASLDPEERIRTALAAAQRFSAGVREPFVVRSI